MLRCIRPPRLEDCVVGQFVANREKNQPGSGLMVGHAVIEYRAAIRTTLRFHETLSARPSPKLYSILPMSGGTAYHSFSKPAKVNCTPALEITHWRFDRYP